MPVLAICRGFQEMNVAFGGTLWQKLHEVAGLRDHREDPRQPLEEQYGPAHEVVLSAAGCCDRLAGTDRITREFAAFAGRRPARAATSTSRRARRTASSRHSACAMRRRFAVAVQWHPEWQVMSNPFSRALFAAFGEAARERAQETRKGHRL